MTDPTDTSLKAAVERVYDEIQQREGKPRPDPPKAPREEVARLQACEWFIKLCQRASVEEHPKKVKGIETAARPTMARAGGEGQPQKALRPHPVRVWIEEYKNAANGAKVWSTCPASYAPFVKALADAQGEGELDLREENVRRVLLGGRTFDESVIDLDSVESLWQSKAGRKPRPRTLMKEIIAIVAKNPEIAPEGLWDRLLQRVCPGTTIFEADDDAIWWKDAKGKECVTYKRAIKDLLYRARKALKALDRP